MISIVTIGLMLGVCVFVYLQVKDLPQLTYQYDTLCDRYYANCRVKIDLQTDLTAPVYLFIQVDPISQTSYPFVHSFSHDQLSDNLKIPEGSTDVEELKQKCDFSLTNDELSDIIDIEAQGLNPIEAAYPCGLMTKFFPTDDFFKIEQITAEGTVGASYPIEKTGLISEQEKTNSVYKRIEGKQYWLDVTSERFFIWMKRSSMSGASKLWGKINNDLPKGEYYIHIYVTFDVSTFNGKKFFILNGNVKDFSTRNIFVYILPTLLVIPLMVLSVMVCIQMRKNSKDGAQGGEEDND